MEKELKKERFELEDAVTVVTDRPLKGYVTGIGDIPHVGAIEFSPQSFQGQKGWIFAGSGGDYEVSFRLQGNPRTVVMHQRIEEAGILSEERQFDRGRGHLWDVKAEDLALDPGPEGTFETLMDEMYEAGEFDLDPIDVLAEAESLLDAREAALEPERYVSRRREGAQALGAEVPETFRWSLEADQRRWEEFKKGGSPSISAYITGYIEREDGGRLDWTAVLTAVEQAERGDRTAFDGLLESVYIRGAEFLPLAGGHPDPGVPTTACFDCDAVIPVADTWVNKKGRALCEACFLKREVKKRARRRQSPFPAERE